MTLQPTNTVIPKCAPLAAQRYQVTRAAFKRLQLSVMLQLDVSLWQESMAAETGPHRRRKHSLLATDVPQESMKCKVERLTGAALPSDKAHWVTARVHSIADSRPPLQAAR